jgi:hypothetical protein
LFSLLTILPLTHGATTTVIPVDNFNSPQVAGNPAYTDFTYGNTFGSSGKWTVTGGSVDLIGTSFWQTPDGNQNVDMDGTSVGQISTTITIPNAGNVTVSFWLAGNMFGNTPGSTRTLQVSLGAASQTFTFDINGKSHANMGWVAESAVFANQSAGPETLTFTGLDGPLGYPYEDGPVLGTVTASVTRVAVPPSILAQPLTRTAEIGTTPWFWVEVTNTLPGAIYYQWYFFSNPLGSATNSHLALVNVQPSEAGAYTVIVTNLGGAVTSAPALLSVIPPVDRRVGPAVHLPGGTGNLLHLEYAESLVAAVPQWLSLTNVTLSAGPQFCFQLSQPLPAQRFYRAWQTNGPQPTLDMSLATEIPLTGAVGSSMRVDYINAIGPTNAWVTLDTLVLTNTTQLYFDTSSWGQPARLYRLVPSP